MSHTVVTVHCSDCTWCTDLEILSETNPWHCPECGGEILVEGTDQPLDEYLESREVEED